MTQRPMAGHTRGARGDAWYKEAIIYAVDVDRFFDSDGDGIGDFHGLTTRLDYLASLGVTCLWLLPFYESPNRDNGYDIVDYYSVDHRLGTFGDFAEFMNRAEQVGLRVLVDLVINHTSKDHPWFQAARRDPKSPFRDFYIWSKKKPSDEHEVIVFPGPQTSNWTYDRLAGEYYMHTFYSHQPDLNLASEKVREEILKVMGFWLKLGVSGFRVDAVPFLIELHDPDGGRARRAFEYLGEMHRFASWRAPQSVLLAEANVNQNVVKDYVGNGDRMHLMYNFIMNQYIWLALARGNAEPLIQGIEMVPDIPPGTQWVQFLRKLDELDLASSLTKMQREEIFAAFGPDPKMQAYGRGLRRRVAPMLGGDRRRIELAFSLTFSLPGTPMLVYGDEIGLGEDLSQTERESVRLAMQWSNDRNAGFSSAKEGDVKTPMLTGGPFGPERVNVADQEEDSGSLLGWMQRLIRTVRRHPELGHGRFKVLDVDVQEVFATRSEWEEHGLITLHNLSDRPLRFKFPCPPGYRTSEVFANRVYEQMRRSDAEVELDPYGYRWIEALPPQD